jgi:hypothetical protein
MDKRSTAIARAVFAVIGVAARLRVLALVLALAAGCGATALPDWTAPPLCPQGGCGQDPLAITVANPGAGGGGGACDGGDRQGPREHLHEGDDLSAP